MFLLKCMEYTAYGNLCDLLAYPKLLGLVYFHLFMKSIWGEETRVVIAATFLIISFSVLSLQ